MKEYKSGELIAIINGESFYFIGKDKKDSSGYLIGRNTTMPDEKTNIKIRQSCNPLPEIIKNLFLEQINSSKLTEDMQNFCKQYSRSEEKEIVIVYQEFLTKELTRQLLKSALNATEKGLHRNNFPTFNISENEGTKLYLDTAAEMYSMFFEVDKNIVMKSITKHIGKYSRGNYYLPKDLEKDIMNDMEKLSGRKIIIDTGCQKKLEKIINKLFHKAFICFKEDLENKNHAYEKYMILEEIIWNTISSTWGIYNGVVTCEIIKKTIEEFIQQNIEYNNQTNIFLKQYMCIADKRRVNEQ